MNVADMPNAVAMLLASADEQVADLCAQGLELADARTLFVSNILELVETMVEEMAQERTGDAEDLADRVREVTLQALAMLWDDE